MTSLKQKLIIALVGILFGCVIFAFIFGLTFAAFPMTAPYMGPFYGLYGKTGSDALHFFLPGIGVVLSYASFFWIAVYRYRRLGLILYAFFVISYIGFLIADPRNVSFVAYPRTLVEVKQFGSDWYRYLPNWAVWSPYIVLNIAYLKRILRR